LTKNTFEVLKKLHVVNQAAVIEIDRVRKRIERHSDFEDDYWNASETEEKLIVNGYSQYLLFRFYSNNRISKIRKTKPSNPSPSSRPLPFSVSLRRTTQLTRRGCWIW